MFSCAICGKEVKVDEGKIARECGHDDAPVSAFLSAECFGEGSADGGE